MSDLVYTAPPTLAKFIKSNAYGRIAMGPVGSGKTTACLMDCFRRAVTQAPGVDGLRWTRFAIIRKTLKQLKDTVLRDAETWFTSRGLGHWRVSDSMYQLSFDDVRSEWFFVPLEDAQEQARLLSMQLTGAWINEIIECDISILGPISGRIGRYPSGPRGIPSWYGILADTNTPTVMSPWHQFCENLPADWQLFRQPGGMTDEAENLEWLLQTTESMKFPPEHPARRVQGRKYYERLVQTYGEHHPWTIRYVHSQYGQDPSGEAVFAHTFRPDFHLVDETLIIPGYPLLVGQDFGRNPWSVICQPDHLGRLIVHEEVPGINCGLEKHINENLRPRLLHEKYLGLKVAVVGDPSGVAKGTVAEESCFDALKRLGLSAIPAPSNIPERRISAVEALLARHTNGGPTLVINRRGAPFLSRAMSGGYRFGKTKEGNTKPLPDKNFGTEWQGVYIAYSHVADALQYAALTIHGGLMPYVRQILMPKQRPTGPRITAAGWT